MLNKIIASILLILFSPIFLFILILIFIEDGFPLFFIQQRIGKNLKYFSIYKFRSMRRNTPNLPTHLLLQPELYLLNVGKIIRKLSIDELPNLLNIIKGDMGFIGPRPALYNQDDLIKLRIENKITTQLPGITGLAQIKGRDNLSIYEKVHYEIEYLQKKSIFLDIYIIYKTFINIFNIKEISH